MRNVVAGLTIFLVLVFTSMVAYGGYLVYQENRALELGSPESSDFKLNVGHQSASFEITNALPGLIILLIGGIGLISMVFKLPVKEVLGYQSKGGGNGIGFIVKERVLSQYIISVPYPVWLLLKRTDRLEQVNESL
jgi:hypothetical protein